MYSVAACSILVVNFSMSSSKSAFFASILAIHLSQYAFSAISSSAPFPNLAGFSQALAAAAQGAQEEDDEPLAPEVQVREEKGSVLVCTGALE